MATEKHDLSFQALKDKQRAIREGFQEDLGLREDARALKAIIRKSFNVNKCDWIWC